MTKFSALISVIVPVYNVEQYLPKCVDSVISQGYRDIEVILVDDGSPDNCPAICDDYARRDPRIKAVHKKNGGLSSARNAGIRAASGAYIVFLDGDDWLEENSLKGIADTAAQKGPDMIVGNVRYMDGAGGESGESGYIEKADVLERNPAEAVTYFNEFGIYWPAFRFIPKKSFLEEKGLFFYEGVLHEDLEWVPRAVAAAGSFALYMEKFYCYRTVREGSITGKKTFKNYADMVKVSASLYKTAGETQGAAREYVLKGAKTSLLLSMEGYGRFDADEKKAFRSMITGSATVLKIMEEIKRMRVFLKVLGLWNGLRAYAFIADIIGKINKQFRNA